MTYEQHSGFPLVASTVSRHFPFGFPLKQDVKDDVEGALLAGLQAILVRSGKYRQGDEAKSSMAPTAVCDHFSAAVDFIVESR